MVDTWRTHSRTDIVFYNKTCPKSVVSGKMAKRFLFDCALVVSKDFLASPDLIHTFELLICCHSIYYDCAVPACSCLLYKIKPSILASLACFIINNLSILQTGIKLRLACFGVQLVWDRHVVPLEKQNNKSPKTIKTLRFECPNENYSAGIVCFQISSVRLQCFSTQT